MDISGTPETTLNPPLTLDEVYAFNLAMQRRKLESRGVYFSERELPELDAAAAAASVDANLLATVTAPQDLAAVVRRRRIQHAMNEVGERMLAEGRLSAPPVASVPPHLAAVLEPTVWPSGIALMRSIEHAAWDLSELDRAAEIGETPADDIRTMIGLGHLFSEDEVASLFDIPVGTLKVWRSQRKHFPFLKFPGQRGIVRYPEVGIRAFIDRHSTPHNPAA